MIISNGFSSVTTCLTLRKIALLIAFSGTCIASSPQQYFQQRTNFRINVELNDLLNELSGSEQVTYINNSPDTLNFIYFHLWPNAYSSRNTSLAEQLKHIYGNKRTFSHKESQGYTDSIDFHVDGTSADWKYLTGTPDICKVNLAKPLLPGDTVLISTPFHVKLPPGTISRLGYSNSSYQVSQWYPKPAVYDINGWHQMHYLDQGEFFSEFGRYEVSITVPSGYIVGASGDLQNEDEIEMLDMLASGSTYFRQLAAKRAAARDKKTLLFIGENIHDFAWFADRNFMVGKEKILIPESQKQVTVYVLFSPLSAGIWEHAPAFAKGSILYFSRLIGDYPYNTMTIVQGKLGAGAGMEYPGITVIGSAQDQYSLDEVIAHEICHNWFYASLASDERQFPFMDESITSAYTDRYLAEKYPDKKLWEIYFPYKNLARLFDIDYLPVTLMPELLWLDQARQNLEQPVGFSSEDFSNVNYEVVLYYKAAKGFNYLRAYLGDSVFDLSMKKYFERWAGRHPGPGDLRQTVEEVTGKDLDWFFSGFITGTPRLDYKIVRSEGDSVLVKNNGGLEGPVIVAGYFADTIAETRWVDGFTGEKWVGMHHSWSEARIDPLHVMPEYNRLNNNINTSGLCRKYDPLRLRLYFTMEDPDKRTLVYLPLVNWNGEDGIMAGIALNNRTLIAKTFQYSLIPFYSFNDRSLKGFSRMTLNLTPQETSLRLISLSVEGAKFGAPELTDYRRAKTGVSLHFKGSKIEDEHILSGDYSIVSDFKEILSGNDREFGSFMHVGYRFEKHRMYDPWDMGTILEFNRNYLKAAFVLNNKYNYTGPGDGLDLRIFTGFSLKRDERSLESGFAASGRSGRQLYLYQGTFPGRFNVFPGNFWARQMMTCEGMLVTPVNDSLGYGSWLFSIGISSSLPGKASMFPIKPFVNCSVDNSPGRNFSPLFFEAGFKTGIWDIFEVYFPVLLSEDLGALSGSFKERIRFIFDPETLLRTLFK